MHVRSWRRFGALLAGAALLPVLAASPVSAAGIVVNSKTMLTQDDGTCTLPEAIKAANTDAASGVSSGECPAGSGADVITFSVTGTILTTRLPDITGPVTINGDHKVTLNGQGATAFFIIHGNPVYLQGLVFTNGRASFGGAFFVADGAVVYLEGSTVSNSRAQQGGGILVGGDGLLYIADSTISGNSASNTGGGIHVQPNADAYLRRSTVSGNSSAYGAGAYVSGTGLLGTANTTFAKNTASVTGGAAYVGPNGFLSLYNSTVALNAATTSIGGVYMDNLANADVQNAIVAGNSKGNVSAVGFGTTVSSIIGGSITGLLDSAGLQSNGGPTKTIKLLSTAAAAIDDGNQSVCDGPGTGIDQRGLTRGTPCDIGAVERDRTAPTTTAPTASLRSGVKLSGTGMSTTIRWSGADGAGSGVARYQLQQRVNGGSYSTVSSSLTGTSKTFTLANGSDYQFRVRAVDRDGNTGAYATSAVFKPRLTQNSSASITYVGSWSTATSTAYSGGSVKYATQTDNETATYTFTGRSVAFVTTTAKTRGLVRIYIDGQIAGLLDLYSSTTTFRKAFFAKSWPASGAHTIVIESYGGVGRTRVDIDAFAAIK